MMEKQELQLENGQRADSQSSGELFEPGEITADVDPMMTSESSSLRSQYGEEESLEGSEGLSSELLELETEKDTPLETLLAPHSSTEDCEGGGIETDGEAANNDNGKVVTAEEGGVGVADVDEHGNEISLKQEEEKFPTLEEQFEYDDGLPQSFPEEPDENGNTSAGFDGRELRSGSRQQTDNDFPVNVRIGLEYQAEIPELVVGLAKEALKKEEEPDDGHGDNNDIEDKLMWNPEGTTDEDLVKFLAIVKGVENEPEGSFHLHDNEEALSLLLDCDNDYESALKVIQSMDVIAKGGWTEEECLKFERGLRHYGKDFKSIQENDVPTRSVGELVEFYYFWKKTERHDVFIEVSKHDGLPKFEKKRYAVHPGTTNYMEKFLDDQEIKAESSVPSYVRYLLESSSSPSSSSTSQQQLPLTFQGDADDHDPMELDDDDLLMDHPFPVDENADLVTQPEIMTLKQEGSFPFVLDLSIKKSVKPEEGKEMNCSLDPDHQQLIQKDQLP